MHTWDSSLMLGNQDSPVDQSCYMWEGGCSSVEDAEPGAVLGGLILMRRGQDSLKEGSGRLRLVSAVRIVEMHQGPGLR